MIDLLHGFQVATKSFVPLTYTLMDIIPIVGRLNLFLQKDDIDVALVKVNGLKTANRWFRQ